MVRIIGTSESETITGTYDTDHLFGLNGDDHLIGDGQDDLLVGGGGADLLEGGEGDDYYNIDVFDTVIDTAGWDTIRAGHTVDLTDFPDIENLEMLANTSGRQLLGNSDLNVLSDADGSNLLDGRAGDDALFGNAGNDILVGGLGDDTLVGGADSDRFDFYSLAETGVGEMQRDIIADFESGDRLNLGRIDADAGHSGNQAFRFLGATDFTGTAGELVTYQQTVDGELTTVLAGDTNGDGLADFEIELRGQHVLSAVDFIL